MYCPCVAYVKFSADGFTKKHLLGVFDEAATLKEELDRSETCRTTFPKSLCGSASYYVGNELEKLGWHKVQGSGHDLEKDGLGIQIRHSTLVGHNGTTVDRTWASLQPPHELLDRMLVLLANKVWE